MRNIVILLYLFSSISVFSQEDAWVYFKDKPNFQSYLNNPLTMLSQRALDRRQQQEIALDIKDVPIHESYINQISSATGISIKAKSKWLNCLHIRGSIANINALKELAFVSKVDFADTILNGNNGMFKEKTLKKRVEKFFNTKTTFDYGTSSNQITMLNGHLLHKLNYTGSGKMIAVLDDGFMDVNTAAVFKRLRDNSRILGGYNFVNKSSNFYSGGTHGTEVLSLMGGFHEGKLVGTAPDANYYLYLTEDSSSENPVEESNWVEAAEEADKVGVDIITSSLGYFDFDDASYNHTYSQMTGNSAFVSKGANIAFEKGILVLASAGNSGASTTAPYVAVPAEAVNVIAVGAVKGDKTYASFSSIGPSFDGRVKPDVIAQGENAYLYSGGTIAVGNGTSYSCPILAGMVACLCQALPTKTAKQIKKLIVESADNFTEPAQKSRTKFGFGIPNFNSAFLNGLSVGSFSKTDFLVYPNPTTDIVYFSTITDFRENKITIYTILGQKVLEVDFSTATKAISLQSLNAGTYIYKIESNHFSKTGMIIKL